MDVQVVSKNKNGIVHWKSHTSEETSYSNHLLYHLKDGGHCIYSLNTSKFRHIPCIGACSAKPLEQLSKDDERMELRLSHIYVKPTVNWAAYDPFWFTKKVKPNYSWVDFMMRLNWDFDTNMRPPTILNSIPVPCSLLWWTVNPPPQDPKLHDLTLT